MSAAVADVKSPILCHTVDLLGFRRTFDRHKAVAGSLGVNDDRESITKKPLAVGVTIDGDFKAVYGTIEHVCTLAG